MWFLKSLPTSASGTGTIAHWKDGRDLADTVQCIIEFPAGVRMITHRRLPVLSAILSRSFKAATAV
jgi:hypothetical protein